MFKKVFAWLKRTLTPLSKTAKNRLWFERNTAKNNSRNNIGLIARSRRWGARFSFSVKRKFVSIFLKSVKGFIKFSFILLVIWSIVYFNQELFSYVLITLIKKYCPHIWMSLDLLSLMTTTTILTVWAFWFAFVKLCKFLLIQWSLRFFNNLGFNTSDLLNIDEHDEIETSTKNSWYVFKNEFKNGLGTSVNNYWRFYNAVIGLFGFKPRPLTNYNSNNETIYSTIDRLDDSTSQRQTLLRSPEFKKLLMRWLETSNERGERKRTILEKLFDDPTLEVTTDYNTFLRRLYDVVGLLETELTSASVFCTTEGLELLSQRIQMLEILKVIKYLKMEQDLIIFAALFDKTTKKRLTDRDYTFLTGDILNYVLSSNLLNYIKSNSLLWYTITQPIHLQSFTINSFSTTLMKSPYFWFLLGQLNQDINSRRWDRWAYKISALERHTLSDMHRLQEILRAATITYFDEDVSKTNLWASSFWDAAKKSNISNYYHLFYGLNANSNYPDNVFKTNNINDLLLNNLTTLNKYGHTTQSTMWLLRRYMYNHSTNASTIRASLLPKDIDTLNFNLLTTKIEKNIREVSFLNIIHNIDSNSPYGTSNQINLDFNNLISEVFIQKYSLNNSILSNPATATANDILLLLSTNEFFTIHNLLEMYNILLSPTQRPYILAFYSAIYFSNISDQLHNKKTIANLRVQFPNRWGLLKQRGQKRYNYFILTDSWNRHNQTTHVNSRNYFINDVNVFIHIQKKKKENL